MNITDTTRTLNLHFFSYSVPWCRPSGSVPRWDGLSLFHLSRPRLLSSSSPTPDGTISVFSDDRTNDAPPRELDFSRCKVEADYTVIFFAAGARHNPGWNWVWKAYRSLSRKYRKNLKKFVSVSLFHLLLCSVFVIPWSEACFGRATVFL